MKFSLPVFDLLTQHMKNLVHYTIEKNLLIVGSPGTGKSVVAIHRFNYLDSKGYKVLLICYNVLLNKLLVSITNKRNCKTINSLYGSICNDVGLKEIGYIDNENKETLEKIFSEYVKKNGKYDAIIIDEGQDLSESALMSLQILSNHITICADPNQCLKNPSSDIRIIKSAFPGINEELLDRNYRNTRQIYESAVQYFMKDNELASNNNIIRNCIDDPKSEPIFEKNVDTIEKKINFIKSFLEDDNNVKKSIGIFTNSNSQVDEISLKLNEIGIKNMKYHSNVDKSLINSQLDDLIVTTYQSAKGLEFDIVIVMVDKTISNMEKSNEKLFVLATRAKRKLYFLFE